MLRRQKGTLTRRFVHAVISVALRLFFRRLQVSGAELVPADQPLIFVLNHPNGLIDPALVFCALPRRVSFLAKSTLFRLPVIGWLMRVVEALPLYRRIDQGEDASRNQLTFRACHDLLRQGRCIALFPEGVSHGAPHLAPLKTGAARIALGALSVEDTAAAPLATLKIVPVGMYYTSHTPFRSEALIQFGRPFEVSAVAPEADGEPPRDEVKRLTARIEAALREVTLNFADAEEQRIVRRAERILSSAYRTLRLSRSLLEEFRTGRRLIELRRRWRRETPELLNRLEARLRRHEIQLSQLGLTPERLSVSAYSGWRLFGHFAFRAGLMLLLFPLAWLGMMLHAPAYLVCELLSRRFRKHGPDEGGATVRVLAAMALMPLTWLSMTTAVWFGFGWGAALAALPGCVVSGCVALAWMEEAYELKGWLRALLLLAGRRRLFLRLLRERRALGQEISR